MKLFRSLPFAILMVFLLVFGGLAENSTNSSTTIVDGTETNRTINANFGEYSIEGASENATVNYTGNDFAVRAVEGNVDSNVDIESTSGGVSFAGGSLDQDGDISAVGIGINSEGATIDVDGNVSSENEAAISDHGDSNIDIDGDVSSSNSTAVVAEKSETNSGDSSKITIDGNVTGNEGAIKSSEAEITVIGSVTATNGTAIDADKNSDITVTGNVTGTIGIDANDSKVEVKGDVKGTSGSAVIAQSDAEVTVTGSVTGSGIVVSAQSGSDVTINGDVTGTGGTKGIYATDSGTEVTVNDGNVTAEYTNAIQAAEGAEVTVTGDVSSKNSDVILASNGAEVTIEGAISSEKGNGVIASSGAVVSITGNVDVDTTKNAISAEGGSSITVVGDLSGHGVVASSRGQDTEINITGDITATGENSSGANAVQDASIYVDGSVTADGHNFAVSAIEGGTIEVTGDVTGEDTTLLINNGGEIIVGGDVTSNDGDGILIVWSEEETSLIVEGDIIAKGDGINFNVSDAADEQSVINNLPTVIVSEISVEQGEILRVNAGSKSTLSESSVANIQEELAKIIQYIVNDQTSSGVSLTGTKSDTAGRGLTVAYEGDQLIVKAPDGYRFTSVNGGSIATVAQNSDGTYTITVNRGGDLTITATIEVIPAPEPTYDSSDDDDDEPVIVVTPVETEEEEVQVVGDVLFVTEESLLNLGELDSSINAIIFTESVQMNEEEVEAMSTLSVDDQMVVILKQAGLDEVISLMGLEVTTEIQAVTDILSTDLSSSIVVRELEVGGEKGEWQVITVIREGVVVRYAFRQKADGTWEYVEVTDEMLGIAVEGAA